MNVYFDSWEVSHNFTTLKVRWHVDFDDSKVFRSHELSINFNYSVNVNIYHVFFVFMNVITAIYCKFYKNRILSIHFPLKEEGNNIAIIKSYQNIEFNYFSIDDKNIVDLAYAPISPEKKYRNALFYGGGKDSLLSALIQKKLYEKDEIVLLRLVWDENSDNLGHKKEAITNSLNEMKKLGISSHLVESNYHCIVASRQIGKLPNLVLYPSLMLPIIDIMGVSRIVNGYDASEFYDSFNKNKAIRFLSARPENLKKLSDLTSTLLNRKVYYRNYNYGILPNLAFEIISKEFPESWGNIYMCERLSGKWCIKCRKCFTYALACLAYDMDSDFNLGYFFQTSIYVNRLLNGINENIVKGREGQYIELFSAKVHFIPMLSLLRKIDKKKVTERVHHLKYPDAADNLFRIIEYYSKNEEYADYDSFWGRACLYEMEQLKDPNMFFEKLKIFEMLINNEIGISFKSSIQGLNGFESVSYNYSSYKVGNDVD